MTLIGLIVVLCIVGVLLWLITIINVVVVIVVVLWLLNVFGLLGGTGIGLNTRIGR